MTQATERSDSHMAGYDRGGCASWARPEEQFGPAGPIRLNPRSGRVARPGGQAQKQDHGHVRLGSARAGQPPGPGSHSIRIYK